MSRQFSAESSIKAELRLRSKDSKETASKSVADRKKVAANLAFDAFGYRFSNKSEIKRVLVTVIESEGVESFERFQFENIALDQVGQRNQLKYYFAGLERASPDSDNKKRSTKTVRVWKDRTFRLEERKEECEKKLARESSAPSPRFEDKGLGG